MKISINMNCNNCSNNISCAICLENILPVEEKITCHPVHISCVKKHFKPECPVCRRVLDIVVTGAKPKCNLVWSLPSSAEEEPEREDYTEAGRSVFYPCPLQIMKTYGLLPSGEGDYEVNEDLFEENREEDFSEDEENPRGDDWDYGSTPRSDYTEEFC